METLKLYLKEKMNCFWLIKLLFINARCLIMLMLALRLILKYKGGKQHCLIPFVSSNLGVEIFSKKREPQKSMR